MIFNWEQRMGNHLAYHRNKINNAVHLICIPAIVYGLLIVMSVIDSVTSISVTVGLLLVLGIVFLLVDIIVGAVVVALLFFAAFQLSNPSEALVFSLVVGLVWMIGPFVVQTQVGHRVFEDEGRDDTEINIKEFRETLNPIPLVLIFFYHAMEVAMLLGYKKESYNRILGYRDAKMKEIERIEN